MNFSEIPLFDHITDQDCRRMMSCFQTSFVSLNGEQELDIRKYYHHDIGIVLSGSVEISRIDFNGRKSILEIIEKKKCLGGCIPIRPKKMTPLPQSVSSPPKSPLSPTNTFRGSAKTPAAAHTALISNLLELMSKKTSTLSARVNILSQRTIRENWSIIFTSSPQLSAQMIFSCRTV